MMDINEWLIFIALGYSIFLYGSMFILYIVLRSRSQIIRTIVAGDSSTRERLVNSAA